MSPARVARDTVSALELEAVAEPALADIDHGSWSGRSLADLQSAASDAVARWLADPCAGVPDGETMDEVVARVGPWLDNLAGTNRIIMGVTHATVIRAALSHALQLPVRSTLRIDIAPLSVTIFSFNRMWRLQGLREL
jgi:broad specificity phosphatase PhoE